MGLADNDTLSASRSSRTCPHLGLKGKDVVAQFVAIAKSWDQSRMDFVCESSTNRKKVYINFLFWAKFDFNGQGVDVQQRDATIARLREEWESNHIEIPLPACH